MPNPSPNKELIYHKALALLSRREHSRHELWRKLTQRFPEFQDEIIAVLDELQTKKYLVNQRFAEMITRHRAAQGYGPNYIKQELKSHQVMLDEAYFADAEVAIAFFEGWLRKFKVRFKTFPGNSLEQAKLFKYFLQRGYVREQIKEFLERLQQQEAQPR